MGWYLVESGYGNRMTRLCFLCGKKIGLLRSMTDQQYCTAAHRQEARLASAQAYRDEDEMETWSIEKSKNKKKTHGSPGATAGQTASIFAFLTVAGLLVAIPSMFGYNFLVHTLRVRTVELDNFAQNLVSKMETEYLKEE